MHTELSQEQVNNLARPLVGMMGAIEEFFKDPQNEQAYQDWYCKKYGRKEEKNATQTIRYAE